MRIKNRICKQDKSEWREIMIKQKLSDSINSKVVFLNYLSVKMKYNVHAIKIYCNVLTKGEKIKRTNLSFNYGYYRRAHILL